MARWLVTLVLAGILATAAAHAQVIRLLPNGGKLGELTGQQQAFPLVRIDSQVLRLAPGGLIYDQNNRTIVHGQLPESGSVFYLQDPVGDITRLYILRPEELDLIRRSSTR